MADYDSNMIKPVESLQNIAGLTPAKRREERKRRQQLPKEDKQKNESAEDETNESVDELAKGRVNQLKEGTVTKNGRDDGRIDYCA
jgi:hypothetical protein